jgi:sterol desaturase/sphingolipid hydroxylase (fatty acid hydroxylase superfamily)
VAELWSWLRVTPLGVWLQPGHVFFLPFVASSLLIAVLVHRARRPGVPLREFLFPARLYRTAHFRLDLAFALVNQTFYLVLVTVWAVSAEGVADGIGRTLGRIGLEPPGLAWGAGPLAAFSLALFVARDLALFLAHAAQHRVPLLWAFHKVHHTARALTPVSALRAHPVDDVLSNAAAGVLTGIVTAGFRLAFGDGVTPCTILSTHVLVLGFHLLGHHLRHSHVWLSYGPWLGRVLVSPAHHQVHHSRAPRHWNRNLGQFLAIWDGLCGTLYVPGREPEAIECGVSETEDARFGSVPKLYLLPFADAGRSLVAAVRPARNPGRLSTASGT